MRKQVSLDDDLKLMGLAESESPVVAAAAKYGWRATELPNGDFQLFNRKGVMAATVHQAGKKYTFSDGAGNKLMSGSGQLGASIEKLLSQYFYAQLMTVVEAGDRPSGWEAENKRDTVVAELAQPGLDKLNKRFLEIGGDSVISVYEEDLNKLLKRGQQFTGRAKLHRMRNSDCHSNSANWWNEHRGEVAIVTGYALSTDDSWRQHSWLVSLKSGEIIETTVLRKAYYGFQLTPKESEAFLENNF